VTLGLVHAGFVAAHSGLLMLFVLELEVVARSSPVAAVGHHVISISPP
jgi:hypothetical protein